VQRRKRYAIDYKQKSKKKKLKRGAVEKGGRENGKSATKNIGHLCIKQKPQKHIDTNKK